MTANSIKTFHYKIWDGDQQLTQATTTFPVPPGFNPYSLHYFCRGCGKLWAEAVSEDADAIHFSVCLPCNICSATALSGRSWAKVHPWEVPGSLLESHRLGRDALVPNFWAMAVEHFPQQLLARELGLLINKTEVIV